MTYTPEPDTRDDAAQRAEDTQRAMALAELLEQWTYAVAALQAVLFAIAGVQL